MTSDKVWKILLIDDEEDICEITSLALEDSGYRVMAVQNGVDGLKQCARFSPQIVITDIRMPVMDGIQVLETIKNRYPDIEVIVATAFADIDVAIRALQLDASDFITKPIHNDALLVALDRARQRYTNRKKLEGYTRFLEQGWSETTTELLETFIYQKNLIESSMDGILGCTDNEVVVTFNQSMEQMTGYSKSQVLQKQRLGHFFDHQDFDAFNSALAMDTHGGRNRLFLYETRLLTRSRRVLPVQVSAAVIEERGRPGGMVCFFRDMQQIRRLEREMTDQVKILHRDKMMSLGRLSASVVHEINNPMSGILNYIRLMLRVLERGRPDIEQMKRFKHYLEMVESETDRCSKIIANLLTFSRKTEVASMAVNVADLLNRCMLLSQHKLNLGNIGITKKIPDDLPAVQGDFNQLQQCMINLIFNAIDAMPGGGHLTLGAETDDTGSIIRISVQDTGQGIAGEDIPHLFEPFYTTKGDGRGIGLGLSTTFGIVEAHHGTITVKSEEGMGALFLITLPCH